MYLSLQFESQDLFLVDFYHTFNSFIVLFFSCANQDDRKIDMDNLYPWCIVAFDSLERSPVQRIEMLKELGFSKYAFDWRDKNLDEMECTKKYQLSI